MNLRVLLIVLSCLPCATVHAERLLIWGVQDGCTRIPELDKALDRKFYDAGLQTWVLAPQPSSCQGESCAQRVATRCSVAAGRILGGQVQRGKNITRVRLWLNDLSTKQTAYADEFCQDCNLTKLVLQQAQRLWEKPSFGPTPGPTPVYCQNRPAAELLSRPGSNKLYLTVYGDSKSKLAVASALKDVLAETARPIQMVHGDLKQYGPDELARIVGPAKDGQALGVEVLKDGGANLWLYDGPTAEVYQQPTQLECTGCDAKAHVELIKNNLGPLLAHCFGTQCSQVAASAAPAEACEPFTQVTCGDGALVTSSSAGPGIDPKLAKFVKGGLWGVFAAQAASGIALFAADPFHTEPDPNDPTMQSSLHHTLNRGGWAITAAAALTLAIAIPTTILINRAERVTTKTETIGSNPGSTEFRCPK